jgi:outer membrane immunogenic protein
MLGALALAVLGTNSGLAADLGRPYAKAPPPADVLAEPIYRWTGFYVGGHLGGAFGSRSIFGNDTRFAGGLQVGADYQLAPNWVVGIEGQYSWLSGSAQTARFSTFNLTRDRNALGSITGRLGYASGPTLLYVKGGYAYQDTTYGVASLAGPLGFTLNGNKSGYTIGAGLEYLFTPNWSTKIEYQYYNFGRTRFVGVSPTGIVTTRSFDNNEHSVKVGLNYRF